MLTEAPRRSLATATITTQLQHARGAQRQRTILPLPLLQHRLPGGGREGTHAVPVAAPTCILPAAVVVAVVVTAPGTPHHHHHLAVFGAEPARD
jgi:hypothetical protein